LLIIREHRRLSSSIDISGYGMSTVRISLPVVILNLYVFYLACFWCCRRLLFQISFAYMCWHSHKIHTCIMQVVEILKNFILDAMMKPNHKYETYSHGRVGKIVATITFYPSIHRPCPAYGSLSCVEVVWTVLRTQIRY
jgi:hypothetical protein